LPKKFDGLVEAVRYSPDSRLLAEVRIYERRGSTWSDHIVITRDELVRRIKAGKIFVIGTRRLYLASTFEVHARIHLIEVDGKEILTSTSSPVRDDLIEAPLF